MTDQPIDPAVLKERLTPQQFACTQGCGTEPPFTGKFYNHKEDGMYVCVVCGEGLFDSTTKYESGSGWPSFFDQITDDAVKTRGDQSHGMVRDEILCAKCGSHLGHVFPDGPKPTGQRYCVNSASLDFKPRDGDRKES